MAPIIRSIVNPTSKQRMQTQTLAELRAENAKLEGKEPEETPPEGTEPEQLAADDDPQEPDEVGEPSEEEGGETEAEAWQIAEGEESDDTPTTVPIAKHASVRAKLKETVKERDSEIEQLRAEIQQLKGGMSQPPGQPVPPQATPAKPMPKLEDFNHDEAQHAAAVEAWMVERMHSMQTATTTQYAQQQQEQQRLAAIEREVDSHYDRAQELSVKAGIKPETYRAAERAVRQTVDVVAPGQGDAITDEMISRLGQGSEKVMYYLGRNPAEQAKLQQLLRADPFNAMIYLGELKNRITAPVKRKSNAPKPAARLKGGSTSSDDEAKMKRKYKAAKSDQERWKISREAKKAGFNSLGW